MCELVPTQDINECQISEDEFSIKEKPWARLLPLKDSVPSINLVKDSYTFGRDESCDFKFSNKMFEKIGPFSAVSKLHFRISRESTAQGLLVFIHDLSSNGTFLNDQKIGKGKKQPLSNNDEIAVAIQTCKCFIFSNLLSVQTGFPSEVTSKYTVSRRLGRGACGEVRLVFGKDSCQKFAMKIVQKKTFSFLSRAGDNFIDRVQSEVAILMKLNHFESSHGFRPLSFFLQPCIVRIYDVINTNETLYMILELVEYGELFDRVLNLGQLSEDDSKFLFLQIVLATKYLHDNGITHRDLKPENILLSGQSNRCLIKVTDFGLSKFVDGNTMLRTFCGTPTYLAPEVLLTAGAGVYTSSIDVWSLGVILYICLVGYPPFTDERKDYDLPQQILGGHFDFPERFWVGISESAKDLIRRLLTVDPDKRISLPNVLSHPWLADPAIRRELSDLLLETDGSACFVECSNTISRLLSAAGPIVNPIPKLSSEDDFSSVTLSDSETYPACQTSGTLDDQPIVRKRLLDGDDCLCVDKKRVHKVASDSCI